MEFTTEEEIRKNARELFEALKESERVATVMWEKEEFGKIIFEDKDGYRIVLNPKRDFVAWTYYYGFKVPYETKAYAEAARNREYKNRFDSIEELDKKYPIKRYIYFSFLSCSDEKDFLFEL